MTRPLRKWKLELSHTNITIKNSLTVQQRILIANIFLFPILYYLASLYLLSSTLVSKANDIIGRFVVSGKFFKVEHLTRPSALVGFKTPLTDLHLKNLSLILSDTTFPLDQKPSNDKLHPLHPHTHFVRAYDFAFRRKPRIAGLPIEQEIHTASRLYRALLFASLTRRHHVTQLEDRIKALFGVALQLEKPGHAVTMANRLVINSASLPPSTPGPLRTHLFHLIHSSLPTDRRTRHSRGVALEDVEPCAFCLQDQDSVPHLFGYCPVTLSAWVLSQKTIPDIPHIAHPLSLPLMLLLTPLEPTQVTFVLRFSVAVWKARCRHRSSPHRPNPKGTILDFLFAPTLPRTKRSREPGHPVDRVLEFRHQRSLLPPSHQLVFTDGSALGSPGPAGAAFYLEGPDPLGGYVALTSTTNNRAELIAVLIAVWSLNSSNPNPTCFAICSDSEYAIGALSLGHKCKVNRLLISNISQALSASHHSFRFLSVPAHKGVTGNEMADSLASLGSKEALLGGVASHELSPLHINTPSRAILDNLLAKAAGRRS